MYLVHSGLVSKYQDYTVCAKHTVELCKLHTSAKPFVNSCWISQQSSWKVLLEDSGPPFCKHCAVFDKSADENNLLLSRASIVTCTEDITWPSRDKISPSVLKKYFRSECTNSEIVVYLTNKNNVFKIFI